MTRYCLVCCITALGDGPTCGCWVCAVALAYGWPEPLPQLESVRPPAPPQVGTCERCGATMPKYANELDEDGQRIPRRYCGHLCSNRARVAGATERRQQRVDDVLDLLGMGESPAAIASRFGVQAGTLSTLLSRMGHPVESRLFGVEKRRAYAVQRKAHGRFAW